MSFAKSLLLAAGSAIATGLVLDHVTDGYVKEAVIDKINGVDNINNDWEEISIKDFDLLTDNDGNKTVIMPAEDAINLYNCIEDAITMIDPEKSDYEIFGDKALSFEKLYDCIEELLDTASDDVDGLFSEEDEKAENDIAIDQDSNMADINKEMSESM